METIVLEEELISYDEDVEETTVTKWEEETGVVLLVMVDQGTLLSLE